MWHSHPAVTIGRLPAGNHCAVSGARFCPAENLGGNSPSRLDPGRADRVKWRHHTTLEEFAMDVRALPACPVETTLTRSPSSSPVAWEIIRCKTSTSW